jgi:hypothetical protein
LEVKVESKRRKKEVWPCSKKKKDWTYQTEAEEKLNLEKILKEEEKKLGMTKGKK